MSQSEPDSTRPVRSAKLPWWTWVLPLPLVHLAAWFSVATDAGNGIALLYAPVAFGTVMLYWWGPRVLGALYVGGALSVPLWGLPIQYGPLIALPSTLQIALGWWLFMQIAHGRYWLPTLADLIKFLTLGIVVPTLATGLLLATLLALLLPDRAAGFWADYSNGVFGDAVAHLVLAVPVLVLLTPGLSRLRLTAHRCPPQPTAPLLNRSWAEWSTLGGIFIAVAALNFAMPIEQSWIVCGLLMVVLALRFGFRIVVLGTAWTIILALVSHFVVTHGTFHAVDSFHVLTTHSSVVVFCTMSLLIGRALSDLRREIESRKQSEDAMRESQRRYHLLFENMTTGFMHCEIVRDANQRPIDYRVLEANPAFEDLTGLKPEHVVGKTIRQVLPGVEEYWIDVGGQVATSRQPQAFENYSKDLDRYYDAWLFSPAPNQFASIFIDITKRRKAEQSRDLLVAEMDHRVRNNLTAVLSLASQTADDSPDLPSFIASFNSRLKALAASHDLLSRSQWSGLKLADAIDKVVRPFVDSKERLCVIGEPVELKARLATAMCLCLNELSINAVKHGALSDNHGGSITLEWRRTETGQLVIGWTEMGGPKPKADPEIGQGLQLVRDMIEQDANGSFDIEIVDSGVLCRIVLPLEDGSKAGVSDS